MECREVFVASHDGTRVSKKFAFIHSPEVPALFKKLSKQIIIKHRADLIPTSYSVLPVRQLFSQSLLLVHSRGIQVRVSRLER